MSEMRVLERPGQSIRCPFCSQRIVFTRMRNPYPQPFLYCDRCSNVLCRDSDSDALFQRLPKPPAKATDEFLLNYYLEVENTAPPCPCGGHFRLWANVKCPHCSKETPYNHGVQDVHVRVCDSLMIVIDGAMIVGDDERHSWIFRAAGGLMPWPN